MEDRTQIYMDGVLAIDIFQGNQVAAKHIIVLKDVDRMAAFPGEVYLYCGGREFKVPLNGTSLEELTKAWLTAKGFNCED